MDLLYDISVILIPLVAAVTLHEAAHGYAAWVLGDDTAWRSGRVTLNPIAHIDPVGTVAVPLVMYLTAGFLFGWAKPVPVNPHRLAHPRRDMLWIALAGPVTNIVLAVVAAWLLARLPVLLAALGILGGSLDPPGWLSWLRDVLWIMLYINVVLAVVNMIPIPPLDGGRILTGMLPEPVASKFAAIEPWGLVAVIGALFLFPMLGDSIGIELDGFVRLLQNAIFFLIAGIEWVVS